MLDISKVGVAYGKVIHDQGESKIPSVVSPQTGGEGARAVSMG